MAVYSILIGFCETPRSRSLPLFSPFFKSPPLHFHDPSVRSVRAIRPSIEGNGLKGISNRPICKSLFIQAQGFPFVLSKPPPPNSPSLPSSSSPTFLYPVSLFSALPIHRYQLVMPFE